MQPAPAIENLTFHCETIRTRREYGCHLNISPTRLPEWALWNLIHIAPVERVHVLFRLMATRTKKPSRDPTE